MCIYCRQTPCVTTDSRPWVVRLPTALSWELLFPKESVFNLKSVELCPKGGSNRELIVFSVHCLVIRLQESKHASRELFYRSLNQLSWLWLRVHRLVILQARWQILSWFWTACNFCSLDRTTTKMMSNRQPMRIRREQRGFALPAIKNNIFFLVSNISWWWNLFRFVETEELVETQSDAGRSQYLVLTVTEDETTLLSQNTGKWAIASLTHHKFSECSVSVH